MTDLDKAREWAEIIFTGPANARARATAEIIRSLPDQWVDVGKVREIIEGKEGRPPATALPELVRDLRNLLPPKLPTLADMTAEEREACQWMQAKIPDSDQIHVIANVWPTGSFLWRADGHSFHRNNALITPLPGPKLQWPGSGDEPTIAQKEKVAPDQAVTKDVCNSEPNDSETPKSSIKPEDVPDNDLWLVMLREEEWVGRRARSSRNYPWYIASPNGEGAEIAQDSQITLIHKLVPETHELPEGMRLADHAEYGRVVVSPKDDLDGDYRVFCPQDNTEYGANWWYAHKSELTFLDGGN